jgi:hypothetical protein
MADNKIRVVYILNDKSRNLKVYRYKTTKRGCKAAG